MAPFDAVPLEDGEYISLVADESIDDPVIALDELADILGADRDEVHTQALNAFTTSRTASRSR